MVNQKYPKRIKKLKQCKENWQFWKIESRKLETN